MVEPYLVHYPSRDGKWTISAFLYVPFNMARNGQAGAHNNMGPTGVINEDHKKEEQAPQRHSLEKKSDLIEPRRGIP